MNKSELVNAMSVKSRLSKKDCEATMGCVYCDY